MLSQAALPGPNNEPIKGNEVILEKIDICKKWLLEEWEIDLDALRDNVRARQLLVDDAIEQGLSEIENSINSEDTPRLNNNTSMRGNVIFHEINSDGSSCCADRISLGKNIYFKRK